MPLVVWLALIVEWFFDLWLILRLGSGFGEGEGFVPVTVIVKL